VPRKYYQLTARGREELERLRKEWTAFAQAMAALLET
jgi:DNA-binding PadR family transcriptional regulator